MRAPDGTVQDILVVGTPDPQLAASATDAVRQWEFDSTLLNCEPIDVTMHVTVKFTPKR